MRTLIFKAEHNEISTVTELLKSLYMELGEEAKSISFLSDNLIHEILRSGRTEIYLAKLENNEVIGIATLTETQSIYSGGNYGLLDEMYVIPQYRSANIGKQLIEKVKLIAQERKWTRIDVTTPTNENSRVLHFYKKSGFLFTGIKLKLETQDYNIQV